MAIVQRKTNLPMFCHNLHSQKTACAQIEVFKEQGVDLSRIVIGHSSDSKDVNYLEALLKEGCYLGFDRIPPICYEQAETLVELIKRGWEDKIILSHDYYIFIDSMDVSWDNRKSEILKGENGYTHVSKKLIPIIKNMGVSQNQINKLMHGNPLALLTAKIH